MTSISIYPNFIGKLFARVSKLEASDESLKIHNKENRIIHLEFDSFIDIPQIKRKIFGYKVDLRTDISTFDIRFLNKNTPHNFVKFQSLVIGHLSKKIEATYDEFKKLALDQYLRDSDITKLQDSCGTVIESYRRNKNSWKHNFDELCLTKLKELDQYFPISDTAQELRKNYEIDYCRERSNFFDNVERNPLTIQQRLSVARSNDRNLVLAAAGTGKTSVMVAKALDLIDTKKK